MSTVDPFETHETIAIPSTGRRSDSGSGSGRLAVRCPSCHTPMDVAVDTALTDLTCGSCGSHFSLVDQSKATYMAPPLSRLGRFELVERLGVGGFASVWKARDKELDRTVAIKLPRAGGMNAEEQDKFFREARAVAQLRHPNIVSVHEVGRDGDSVYIVSDFVRGVTLGDWLTGQQLTSREAAALCATIAGALHHAHEQGVVHRDLKPANIMIDPDGQPHLMDFGLARREVGEVTVTMEGQVLGTPAYMSPEQAQGEAHQADRRSDIYSLGAILFQLLTGELPFRGNVRMLMHQVIHDEPPSPRTLNANVPRDLETIALKCLEKSPARRYQSGQELADDLRRFLRREPILARPVPKWERAAKWIHRHPAPSALAVLLCVTTIGGIAGLAWHTHSLEQGRRELEVRNTQLEAARQEANDATEGAKKEAAQVRQFAEFLVGAIETADPIHFGRESFGNSWTLDPQQFLTRGRTYVQNSEHSLDPAIRAKLLNALGSAYTGSGRLNEAYDCLKEAFVIRERLSGGAPSKELVSTLNNLGFLNFLFGRYAEAEQQLRNALNFAQDLSPNEGMEREIITSQVWLAATLLETQRGPEIQRLLEDVLAARTPELKDYDRDFAIAALGLALVSARMGDVPSALTRYLQAKQIMEDSEDEMVAVLDLAVQSVFQSVLGNDRAAGETIERALVEANRIVGESHPVLHILRIDLAEAFQGMGKPERARQELEELMPIAQRMFGEKPRTVAVFTHLGDVMRDLNQPGQAAAHYAHARGMIDEKLDHYDDADISYRLGMMSLLDGRAADAMPLFQHTIDFQKKLQGGMQHPVVAYGHIGMALVHASNPADRDRELEKARHIVRQLPADSARVVDRIASFGDTFQHADRHDLAEILYREVLQFHDSQSQHRSAMVGLLQFAFKQFQLAPSDGYSVGRANLGLAQCLLNKGLNDEARPHLERAADIFADQLGAEDPRTLEAKRLISAPPPTQARDSSLRLNDSTR